MFAPRAIYLDGWRADVRAWEIRHADHRQGHGQRQVDAVQHQQGFLRIDRRGRQESGQADEMKQLWFMLASKYKVLPLDASGVRASGDAAAADVGAAGQVRLYPGTRGSGMAPTPRTCAIARTRITAEVEIPKGGAEGVLLAHGGSFGGYTLLRRRTGSCSYSHNYLGIEEYKVISKEKVPAGKVTLRMDQ